MEVYTVNELAKMLKVTRATIYNLMKEEKIKPVIVGARKRFTQGEIQRYLEGEE